MQTIMSSSIVAPVGVHRFCGCQKYFSRSRKQLKRLQICKGKNDDLADIQFDEVPGGERGLESSGPSGLPGRVWRLANTAIDRATGFTGSILREQFKVDVSDDNLKYVAWGIIALLVFGVVQSILSFFTFLLVGGVGLYVASKYFGFEIPYVNKVLGDISKDNDDNDDPSKPSLSGAADLVDVLLSQAEERIEAGSKDK